MFQSINSTKLQLSIWVFTKEAWTRQSKRPRAGESPCGAPVPPLPLPGLRRCDRTGVPTPRAGPCPRWLPGSNDKSVIFHKILCYALNTCVSFPLSGSPYAWSVPQIHVNTQEPYIVGYPRSTIQFYCRRKESNGMDWSCVTDDESHIHVSDNETLCHLVNLHTEVFWLPQNKKDHTCGSKVVWVQVIVLIDRHVS